MDSNPRILIWNCSDLPAWTDLLARVGAPQPRLIEPQFGQAFVHELLFETALPGEAYASAERVVLFFNVDGDTVRNVMQAVKELSGLERPIYAMVTEHSIEWRFCDLLEHLVEERDHFKQMEAEMAARDQS